MIHLREIDAHSIQAPDFIAAGAIVRSIVQPLALNSAFTAAAVLEFKGTEDHSAFTAAAVLKFKGTEDLINTLSPGSGLTLISIIHNTCLVLFHC